MRKNIGLFVLCAALRAILWLVGVSDAQGVEPRLGVPGLSKDGFVKPWIPPAPVRTLLPANRPDIREESLPRWSQEKVSVAPELGEISRARFFSAPVPTHVARPVPVAEKEALGKWLEEYGKSGGSFNPRNRAMLDWHLSQFKQSPLRGTLWLEKGILCRRHGRFTEAISSLENAWRETRGAKEKEGIRIADQALEALVQLSIQLGRRERLAELIAETASRNTSGTTAEVLFRAREALWFFKERAEQNVFCGFTAVNSVCVPQGDKPVFPDVHDEKERRAFIEEGLPLSELVAESRAVGGHFQIYFREPGMPLVVPAVVHWRFGHYSAATEQGEGRIRIQDPHIQFDGWVDQDALDEQISGYLGVHASTPVPPGYRAVSEHEARTVFGRHCVHARDNEGDDLLRGGNREDCAMATYSFRLLNPGVVISDTPLKYVPPIGPDMVLRLTYDQRSSVLPVRGAPVSNFGPNWIHSFSSCITKDGTGDLNAPNSSVRWIRGDGSFYRYSHLSGTQQYAKAKYQSRPELSFLPAPPGSPVGTRGYRLTHGDGSEEIFSRPDGVAEERYYLTRRTDAEGRSMTFSYDSNQRLVKIVDALNRITSFGYSRESGDDPIKIRSITDPYNRTALFSYDSDGRLRKIVDPMGIRSEFRYGRNDFLEEIHTPYGITRFRCGDLPGVNQEPGRYVEAIDPSGDRERVEANDLAFRGQFGELDFVDQETGNRRPPEMVEVGGETVSFLPKLENLQYRNTFYWDKKQMSLGVVDGVRDYRSATIYNWLVSAENTITAVPASIKAPLEGRVWFNYPGQTSAHGIGIGSLPSKILRMVEGPDGNPIWALKQTRFAVPGDPQTSGQPNGVPLEETDPEGRKRRFLFDRENLSQIQVLENGSWRTVLSCSGYVKGRPATVADGTGLVRNFSYNAIGQILQVSEGRGQKSETVRFFYSKNPPRDGFLTGSGDGEGYLMRVEKRGGSGESAVLDEWTYDAAHRVRRWRDVAGTVLTHDYDAFDRLTLRTFPDGTTEQFVYDRLDLHAAKDRLGAWHRTFFDALRHPVLFQDPLGRLTQLEWCKCGAPSRLTDPEGGVTRWKRDLQGRIVEKWLPDGSRTAQYHYFPWSGWLAAIVSGDTGNHSFAYSLSGNVVRERWGERDPEEVQFEYADSQGRMSRISTADWEERHRYQPLGTGVPGSGSLQSVERSGHLLRFAYDWKNRRIQREILSDTGQVSRTESWTYDYLGRRSQTKSDMGTFLFTYNASNKTKRPDSVLAPSGLKTEFMTVPGRSGGPGLLELSGIRHTQNGVTLSRYQYSKESGGRIRVWESERSTAGGSYSLEYSRSGELVGALWKGSQAPRAFRWGYDGNLNRILEAGPDFERHARFNALNQFLHYGGAGPVIVEGTVSEESIVEVNGLRTETFQIPGASIWRFQRRILADSGENRVKVRAQDPRGNQREEEWRFQLPAPDTPVLYDADGNLREEAGRRYTWSRSGRLAALESGNTRFEWKYDGLGRRIAEIQNGIPVRRWVWDGLEILQEQDGAGGFLRNLYSEGESVEGAKLFYARDHLGSVGEMVDEKGQVRSRYRYGLWGESERVEGDKDAFLGYSGHPIHRQTGLVFAPFRVYDANRGRWLSRDPIGEAGGINLYGYVNGDPVNLWDPFGLYIYPTDFIGPIRPEDEFIPIAPPHVSLAANMEFSAKQFDPWWFRDTVHNRGAWDYKQLHRKYENFGNFNYGACGRSFGFPRWILFREAGRSQIVAKTSRPDWGHPGIRFNPFGGSGSFGDDPEDQYWIKKGMEYYDQVRSGGRR